MEPSGGKDTHGKTGPIWRRAEAILKKAVAGTRGVGGSTAPLPLPGVVPFLPPRRRSAGRGEPEPETGASLVRSVGTIGAKSLISFNRAPVYEFGTLIVRLAAALASSPSGQDREPSPPVRYSRSA